MAGSGRSYKSADSLNRTHVFLEVEEETFDWWTDYSCASHLLGGADTFYFHSPALPRAPGAIPDFDARMLKRGQRVRIYVKSPKADRALLQHTGLIDEVELEESLGDGAMVTVQGRDHLAPINDCHVLPSIGLENITFSDVARRFLTERMPGQPVPFFTSDEVVIDNGANVVLLTGKPVGKSSFEKFTLETAKAVAATTTKPTAKKVAAAVQKSINEVKPHAGESVLGYLTRQAIRFGLLIWGTADGKVVIGRPNYDQKPIAHLAMRQGARGVNNNVERFKRHESFSHRPSEIHVYGHSSGGDSLRSNIHAVVYDEEVKAAGLWRAMTVHDQSVRTKEQAEHRARHELALRKQTGDVISAVVADHATDDGAVYAVDTMASVAWDKAGIQEDWYVVSRTFSRSRSSGARTQLQLLPKNAIVLGDGES